MGKFPQTLCDRVTNILRTLSIWSTKYGLGVNPTKKEIVLFKSKYKPPSLSPPNYVG